MIQLNYVCQTSAYIFPSLLKILKSSNSKKCYFRILSKLTWLDWKMAEFGLTQITAGTLCAVMAPQK